MNELVLAPCPCGETPCTLSIIPGFSSKWAWACGDCCGDWHIEFRTQYKNLETPECYELAREAWNGTDRSK